MRKGLIWFFLIATGVSLSACRRGGSADASKDSQVTDSQDSSESDNILYQQIMDRLTKAKNYQTDMELPQWISYTENKYQNKEKGKEFYYLYNEDYETFDMFYLYGDAVIYCVSDGAEQTVMLADQERASVVPWTIYCMQPGGYGMDISGADLNNDGTEEMLVKVTDEENNVLLYIFDFVEWRDLSPYYSELFFYEDRDYSAEREYFYYEYGVAVNEAINEAYLERGTEPEREITDAKEGIWFGFPDINHYSAYITNESKLGFNYYCRDWKCNIIFDFTGEGCAIERIKVQVYE